MISNKRECESRVANTTVDFYKCFCFLKIPIKIHYEKLYFKIIISKGWRM